MYEEEGDLFFEDLSDKVITDDVFSRLLTFPNVLITAHQAFFTQEALSNIAETTLNNASAYARRDRSGNELTPDNIRPDRRDEPSSEGPGEHGEAGEHEHEG